MQGLFIRDEFGFFIRPKSKKQVKELIAAQPQRVVIEATSAFGDEYEGLAEDLPVGDTVYFVGPDPYTSRKFYGTITRTGEESFKVT